MLSFGSFDVLVTIPSENFLTPGLRLIPRQTNYSTVFIQGLKKDTGGVEVINRGLSRVNGSWTWNLALSQPVLSEQGGQRW